MVMFQQKHMLVFRLFAVDLLVGRIPDMKDNLTNDIASQSPNKYVRALHTFSLFF